jgi:hypothetical protein
VAGNAKVTGGKVLNNENYNMLPIAYGKASYTGNKLSGTASFVSVDRDNPGEYKVFVNGLTSSSVIVLSSDAVFAFRIVGIYPSQGYFLIWTWSILGDEYADVSFQFVAYNP